MADEVTISRSMTCKMVPPGIFPAAAHWQTLAETPSARKELMQKKPGNRDTLPQINVHEADLALDLGDTAAARYTEEALPTSTWRPRAQTARRLLLARADDSLLPVLAPLQDIMGSVVIDEVADGNRLDDSLLRSGPYALVISQAMLPGMRGLEVLAKARERGDETPFILIQSIHQNFVRITIGGGPNSIVSTRLVNTVALLDLIHQILSDRDSSHPAR